MTQLGNFGFGGDQRSYSFHVFHADMVPNSELAVPCPVLDCVLVVVQNSPTSSGNLLYGSDRLAAVGEGIELQPGEFSSQLLVKNLNQIWHKELDATTYLNYYIIGTGVQQTFSHLLLEDGEHILLEDGGRIIL
jgi:hypothetical protein